LAFKPNEQPQNEDLETEINKALKKPLQITTNKILAPREIKYTLQHLNDFLV
jgi:hypothetical protein